MIVNIYRMGNCCFEYPSTVQSLDEQENNDIKAIPASKEKLEAVATVPPVEEPLK